MPACVGEHELARAAAGVLVDRDQAGHAVALHELAPHEVARALGRRHPHVHLRAGVDLAEVDREAVGEHQQVAGRHAVADLRLVDLGLLLVGQQHHHHVAVAGGVGHALHPQAVAAGLVGRRRALAQPHHHVHARVLEVQGVRVALGAVAEDGHGLAVELGEIGILVVDHGGGKSSRGRFTAAGIARARMGAGFHVRRGERRAAAAAAHDGAPHVRRLDAAGVPSASASAVHGCCCSASCRSTTTT